MSAIEATAIYPQAFFRPKLTIACFLTFAALWPGAAGFAKTLTFSAERIEHPNIALKNVVVTIKPHYPRLAASITVGEVSVAAHTLKDVSLDCSQATIVASVVRCQQGMIGTTERWPFVAHYGDRRLSIALSPAGEIWALDADFGQGIQGTLTLKNAQIKRLAQWLPETLPALQSGTVNATAVYQRAPSSATFELNAAATDLAFADPSGDRAGEKIATDFAVRARAVGAGWRWDLQMRARSGEVYWRPVYSAFNGQTIRAKGSATPTRVVLDSAEIAFPGIGSARGAAVWDREKRQLIAARVDAEGVKLAPAYTTFAQPVLEKSLLGKLKMAGEGDFSWRYEGGRTVAVDLAIKNASVEQTEGRFKIEALNATLPWRLTESREGSITATSGEFFKIPLGAVRLPVTTKGYDFRIASAAVPVLDGQFQIRDFRGAKPADQWQWQFSGALAPISMERLTQRMGWPAMHGTIAGVIPKVVYSERSVNVEGALLVKVFDGTIVAKNLTIADPAGRVPILKADVDMRSLDLDLLTRTFSFGNIQGRLDADIVGLELAKSKPIAFNAQLRSSPGNYPKRISQRAVQNISAMGGGGAAAVVQRGFLGFFKEFGYDKIGLSCRLHNGICTMDGVEDTPAGFVIVKGSGIPAITVIGYNRQVEFSDLVARLAAVVQNNEKPIVK